MVQDVNFTSNVIPLSNVDGKTMTIVVQYWKKYSQEGLKEIIIQKFSDRIKGKIIEEIRKVFGIFNLLLFLFEQILLVIAVKPAAAKRRKKVDLQQSNTCNGKVFVLDEAIAVRSQAIKNMVEDDCVSNAIPLPNVHNKTMTKVIEYWKKHSEKGVSKDMFMNFDNAFVKLHHSILYNLIYLSC
ncbi:hypothetical protein R3W88_031685 [Solanum pinnatisectum]|uniref:SKP1 component POZ domain-containing protein n=1 Tax=Solanum pinnatisectum TaxID=50273 RepID=A0AAV9LMP4_9SOLN|nr:hypothetical protein R3W88_031685 [Solanum pinnatisectum]